MHAEERQKFLTWKSIIRKPGDSRRVPAAVSMVHFFSLFLLDLRHQRSCWLVFSRLFSLSQLKDIFAAIDLLCRWRFLVFLRLLAGSWTAGLLIGQTSSGAPHVTLSGILE